MRNFRVAAVSAVAVLCLVAVGTNGECAVYNTHNNGVSESFCHFSQIRLNLHLETTLNEITVEIVRVYIYSKSRLSTHSCLHLQNE